MSQKLMDVYASKSTKELRWNFLSTCCSPGGGGAASGVLGKGAQQGGGQALQGPPLEPAALGWLSTPAPLLYLTPHKRGCCSHPTTHPHDSCLHPACVVPPGQGSAFILGLQCRASDHPGEDGHGRRVREPELRPWGAGQAGRTEPKDSRKWREAQHEAAVPCIAESGQSERGQELCAPWCWA